MDFFLTNQKDLEEKLQPKNFCNMHNAHHNMYTSLGPIYSNPKSNIFVTETGSW